MNLPLGNPFETDPGAPQQTMPMRFSELTDTGRKRAGNQDRVLSDPALGLWVVADGMGGHAGGAEASRIACQALHEAVRHDMPLADGFEVAHSAVRSAQHDQPALQGMGSTLVAMREQRDGFLIAWVGDSRVYRYNAQDSGIECLSRDQNVAGQLVADGQITVEQARNHPQRHVLTDCIGQRGRLPTIESRAFEWHPGDRLLLCSDGLHGELSDDEIGQWLGAIRSPQDATQKLLNRALEAGGRDNISLIIIDAPGPPPG
ncbi:MAG: protein phosphatase 2C domain-containing protein [Xanthomonadaceae bacterium]|nr:protein phosphatase 2C domain-containing protein [Xanthomonadaceae bacterium]